MKINNDIVVFTEDYAFVYQFNGEVTVREVGEQDTAGGYYWFDKSPIDKINLEENPETITDLDQIARHWISVKTTINYMDKITDIEDKLMEVTDLLHEAESKFRNLPAEVQELIDEQAGGPGQFYDRVYSSRKNNERAGGAIEEMKALIREGKL